MQVLDNYDKYRKYFSDDQFWGKLKKLARKAGRRKVTGASRLRRGIRRPVPDRMAGRKKETMGK